MLPRRRLSKQLDPAIEEEISEEGGENRDIGDRERAARRRNDQPPRPQLMRVEGRDHRYPHHHRRGEKAKRMHHWPPSHPHRLKRPKQYRAADARVADIEPNPPPHPRSDDRRPRTENES